MNINLTLDPNVKNTLITLPETAKGCQLDSATAMVDGLLTDLRKQNHRFNICNLLLDGALIARVEFTPGTVQLFRVSKHDQPDPIHHGYSISITLDVYTEERIRDGDVLL